MNLIEKIRYVLSYHLFSSLPGNRQVLYSMNQKECSTCGEVIYFKENSSKKFIPFNVKDNKCHFETCTSPPRLEEKKPTYFKPKISYNTIKENKTLEKFIEK